MSLTERGRQVGGVDPAKKNFASQTIYRLLCGVSFKRYLYTAENIAKVRHEARRRKIRGKRRASGGAGKLQSFPPTSFPPRKRGAELRNESGSAVGAEGVASASVGGRGWPVTSRKMQQGAAMQRDEAKLGGTGPVGLRQPSAICWMAPLHGSAPHRRCCTFRDEISASGVVLSKSSAPGVSFVSANDIYIYCARGVRKIDNLVLSELISV